MSNTSMVKLKVSDWELLERVCGRIGAKCTIGEALHLKLFESTHTAQAIVHLPEWRYPIGITKEGNLYFDSYGSTGDPMARLVELRNEYTLSAAEKDAKRKRRKVSRRLTNKARPGWQFVEIYV